MLSLHSWVSVFISFPLLSLQEEFAHKDHVYELGTISP